MTAQKLTQAQIDAKFGERYEPGDRVRLNGVYRILGTVIANNSMRGVQIKLDDRGDVVFLLPSEFRLANEVTA